VSRDVLGVISAGGVSSRYGSPKALAEVGGVRAVDRVLAALRTALDHDDVVAIVNDPDLAERIGLPHRGDVLPNTGALAGVHTALLWSAERQSRGALVLGCDMPLIEPELLSHILALSGDADIVIPESTGPRGVEPLCAYYSTVCIAAIEAAVAAGNRRMIGFHGAVRVLRIPLSTVRQYGDPDRIFLNLNTPADRDAADRWLNEAHEDG
jgi:molybdopterin-guanine dinucleotide biosynthesis protein A